MGERAQANIVLLNSKINEYRSNDKYCDVDIRVDGKVFKCHRLILGAASEYFDTMFNGSFKESSAAEIQLYEVEAFVFEKLLEFFYTGDVLITDRNLFGMIRASEFYKLAGLEVLCVEYIDRKFGLPIENVFEMFSFARAIGKKQLIKVLIKYIRENFEYFSKIDDFLEINFDELYDLLSEPLPTANQDVLMDAIILWVYRSASVSSKERDQVFNRLVKKVDFSNISPRYMEYVIKRYLKDHMIFSGSASDGAQSAQQSTSSEVNLKSLHIFLKSSSYESELPITNVFSLHRPQIYKDFEWGISCEIERNLYIMRSIVLDNHLYCLSKTPAETHCRNPKKRKMSDDPVQTFSVSSSISLSVNMYLKPPPIILDRFDLCGMDNRIYVYNKNNYVAQIVDDEKLSRSVLLHYRDIDKWSVLSSPRHKVRNACMTCDNQTVYLIGGASTDEDETSIVQAYDSRAKNWSLLPPTVKHYEAASCCVLKGKIYVSGGTKNLHFVEVYDPVAGKWDRTSEMALTEDVGRRQLVTYEDILVSICTETINFEAYNPRLEMWYPLPSIWHAGNLDSDWNNKFYRHSFIDCVVFKPHGL